MRDFLEQQENNILAESEVIRVAYECMRLFYSDFKKTPYRIRINHTGIVDLVVREMGVNFRSEFELIISD